MKKIKVLLVDDNPVLLKLGKEIFESDGYEVVGAGDGEQALGLLAQNTIGVVITDILMPNMDGYSLCYNIRNNENYKNIPIIIYSATYVSQNDEKLALDIGADMYISKPAGIQFLLDTTREIISKPRKNSYKVNQQHELAEVTRLYNARFIEKLGEKNKELENTQAELLKSESRFRALVENISDAISLHDELGNILYQSPSVERITGYTQEETKGKSVSDFFHPDDISAIQTQLTTVLKNPGIPMPSIKRFLHKKGYYVWTEGTTTNMLADKNVRAIVANFRDITERKLAEETIDHNEKRFRALIENNFDAVSLFDKHGIIQYISPGAERMLGRTLEEVAGMPGTDFFHPDDVPEIWKRMEVALQNPGKPIFRTNRLRHKDGHYLWVEGTTTNLLEDENVGAFVGNFRDITERKLAEETIRKNQKRIDAERERFSDLFLQAPSCICILAGKDHIYEMANPLYLELTGKKDIIGKTAAEVFPELVEQGFLGLLDNVYHTGNSCSGKEVFIQIDKRGDGLLTDHYMDFVYQPYKNDEGVTEGIFFFANLVTEQVVARKKVEQREKYFRALVENASDLIVLTDGEGKITYVSPSHEKIIGCKPETVIGKSFLSFQHMDNVAELEEKFIDLLNSPGVPMPRTSRFRRKDGGYLWAEGTVTNLLADENVQGIVANFRDITEHKLYEEKLINANRLYAFISQINQSIVHLTSEDELYKDTCRIALELGDYKMAWIGKVDTSLGTISLIQGAGISAEDKHLFQDVRYDNGGPQYRAIETGSYYVCNDVKKDLETQSWKPFAAKYSLNSCMVLPIKKSGKIVATFNLYSSELNLFNKQEINLLQEVVGDISFALDVFEREKHRSKMEDQIAHSELRLKQAQAIAHFGSWELDYETGIAKWSEEFCRIYGLSPEESIQTYASWISFIHPDDLAYTKKTTNDARKSSSGFAFRHRIIRKDGTKRYIFSQAEFEFDNDGNPVSLHGVAHDETEMRESEEALKQSEENLRLIMDMIPQSIFAKNYNGKLVFINKSFTELYGLDPRDLLNKSAWEAMPVKSESGKFMKEDQDVILSGETRYIPEQTFTDRNGRHLVLQTVKVPFTIAGTNEKAVLGITTDITEQKKVESERVKMVADIVQRNKDLEQFSYIVSHNLRAPVANILGLVNIIETIGLEQVEEKKVMSFLGTATRNLDTVIKDINSILDLKQQVSEKKELIEFEALLSEVKSNIKNQINEEQFMIIGDFSQAAEIFTLKSYLYSIFLNLISNSIKYRQPESIPVIKITSRKIGNKIRLTFKDNGLGIDLQKKGDELFGLYKRFHFHVEGKGIGMYMVKTQVETLGGTISVSSEVNKGTEFTIEFQTTE